MPRRIRNTTLQGVNGGSADDYFARIIKYIPADIVAAWTAVQAALKPAAGAKADATMEMTLWACFAVGLILAPIWTWLQTRDGARDVAVTQIIVSTVAFVVWVFAIGSPFSELGFYKGYMGTVALIGFTLISGKIVPKED